MNTTPQSERKRIVFLGRCNVGKSSLLNAIAGQNVAVVSEQRGTTTDPVRKAMEILPVGPVLLCDTPGLDDTSEIGSLRMERTRSELRQADLAVIVFDAAAGYGEFEKEIYDEVKSLLIPVIFVASKCDLAGGAPESPLPQAEVCKVSALNGDGIENVKLQIIKALPEEPSGLRLAADLVPPGGVAVLVVPIDSAAPKGRLILPQQQVVRDLLDNGAIPVVARDSELEKALQTLKSPPSVVITDSQAFATVSKIVPEDVPLTSFSILFARHKGNIAELLKGASKVASLKDGDKVLIAEGCTHHRQADDIGTVKIPRLLEKVTGKKLVFDHTAGMLYPANLSEYALVIHCGGCMLSRKEVLYRIECAKKAGVPIVNYGVVLACLNGILERAVEPLNLQCNDN